MKQRDAEKLEARWNLVEAWEEKYGEPSPRVITNFLMTAPKEKVLRRFADNPGPHFDEVEDRSGIDTAALEIGFEDIWEPTIGTHEDVPLISTEFGEDPRSLVQKMVPVYRKAFIEVWGREPTPAELEMVMAVGRHETLFGTAKFTSGLGPGMHNHGAVQCHGNCTDENSFPASDTTPLDSGGSKSYQQRFRRYPNDVAGAKDLIRAVGMDPHRNAKANRNSVPAFSLGMYGNRYYESFNASPTKIAANKQVFDWIRQNANNFSNVKDKRARFRDAMMRAQDPLGAGRVLMHAISIDKNAASNAKALGIKRETFLAPTVLGKRPVLGASLGGIVGFLVGGPYGAAAGAAGGYALGRHFQ